MRLWTLDGQWCDDQTTPKLQAVDFFKRLYYKEKSSFPSYPIRGWFPKLSHLTLESIQRPIKDNEAYEALSGMKPLKAPRVDGSPASSF